MKMDTQLKREAQRMAKRLGVPLSAMVKASLRQMVRRDPKVYCPACGEEETLIPSKRLVTSMNAAKRARVRGDYYSFDNAKDAVKFLEDISARKMKL